jgi:hypothetical protein
VTLRAARPGGRDGRDGSLAPAAHQGMVFFRFFQNLHMCNRPFSQQSS